MSKPTCDECGKELPAGSTVRRRYCSTRCRSRHARAGSLSHDATRSAVSVAPGPVSGAVLEVRSDAALPAGAPLPLETWSELVKAQYVAIAASPHTTLWKPADWSALMLYGQMMNDFLAWPRKSPTMFAELMKLSARLGLTQIDRLAAGVDVEAPDGNGLEGWTDV